MKCSFRNRKLILTNLFFFAPELFFLETDTLGCKFLGQEGALSSARRVS